MNTRRRHGTFCFAGQASLCRGYFPKDMLPCVCGGEREVIAALTDVAVPTPAGGTPPTKSTHNDRRRRQRVVLHWPVRLLRAGRPPLETTTENLSSEGFYCITKKPFKDGTHLQCEIVVPGESFGLSEPVLRLKCSITVKHMENIHGAFGLGCHIEDYDQLYLRAAMQAASTD